MAQFSIYNHAWAWCEQNGDPVVSDDYAAWFLRLWDATPEVDRIDRDHSKDYPRFIAEGA